MNSFRFAEGVEYLGEGADGHVHFKVGMPLDPDGYFGRECPSCAQHFRVCREDYETLPDEQRLWCVYCGHNDDHGNFLTQQQRDRAVRALSDYAVQLASQNLDRSLRRMAHRSRGSVLSVSYRSRPFYPRPLPAISEDRLVRERQCDDCGFRYAVFGEHRFCPMCGRLSPLQSALDALAAERIRLDTLARVDSPIAAELRESGVLQRTYVDTIKNVVGIVEVLGDRIFREQVPDAEADLQGRGNVFQRLDDLADLFQARLAVDLRSLLGGDWSLLQEAWAARHVFVHCDGIVDEKYLATVRRTRLAKGQRLQITEGYSGRILSATERLCRAVASQSSPVRPGALRSD